MAKKKGVKKQEQKKRGKSMTDRKPKKRVTKPAPCYDVVGWVTEYEAADIKNVVDPPAEGVVNRTTVSRWRSNEYIHAIDVNGALTLVKLDELKNFPGVPRGNPALVHDLPGYPQRVEQLPDTITLTLKRRKPGEEPNKTRSKWD